MDNKIMDNKKFQEMKVFLAISKSRYNNELSELLREIGLNNSPNSTQKRTREYLIGKIELLAQIENKFNL